MFSEVFWFLCLKCSITLCTEVQYSLSVIFYFGSCSFYLMDMYRLVQVTLWLSWAIPSIHSSFVVYNSDAKLFAATCTHIISRLDVHFRLLLSSFENLQFEMSMKWVARMWLTNAQYADGLPSSDLDILVWDNTCYTRFYR